MLGVDFQCFIQIGKRLWGFTLFQQNDSQLQSNITMMTATATTANFRNETKTKQKKDGAREEKKMKNKKTNTLGARVECHIWRWRIV